jgi:hypothetical protein
MDHLANSLRQMRITHALLVIAVFMQIYVAEMSAGKGGGISEFLVAVIAVVACLDLLLARYFRSKWTITAMAKLRQDPNDANALKQWRAGTLLGLVLAMSVALYGVVLRVLGASRRIAWPFFFVALIFMLVWRPQVEADAHVQDAGSFQ